MHLNWKSFEFLTQLTAVQSLSTKLNITEVEHKKKNNGIISVSLAECEVETYDGSNLFTLQNSNANTIPFVSIPWIYGVCTSYYLVVSIKVAVSHALMLYCNV